MKTKTIAHLFMLAVFLFGQLPLQASAQAEMPTETPGVEITATPT